MALWESRLRILVRTTSASFLHIITVLFGKSSSFITNYCDKGVKWKCLLYIILLFLQIHGILKHIHQQFPHFLGYVLIYIDIHVAAMILLQYLQLQPA